MDRAYQPGVCNIGPPEVARRRRAGFIGLALAAAALVACVLLDLPPLARFLVVALTAGYAAIGFLQARAGFCAGYGTFGLYNFGPLGRRERTPDPLALRLDRRRAAGLYARAAALAALAGLVAAALPL